MVRKCLSACGPDRGHRAGLGFRDPSSAVDWPGPSTAGTRAVMGNTWHFLESTAGFHQRHWRVATLATSNPPPSFQETYRATSAVVSPQPGSSSRDHRGRVSLGAASSLTHTERITGHSTVEPDLPSTRIGLPGSPVDPIAMRFSLQFASQGMLSNLRNLKSFLVLVD